MFLFVFDKTSTPNTRCIYLPGIICCFPTILSFLKLAEITPHYHTYCHRLTSEPRVSTLVDKRLNFLFINDFVHEEGDALLHQSRQLLNTLAVSPAIQLCHEQAGVHFHQLVFESTIRPVIFLRLLCSHETSYLKYCCYKLNLGSMSPFTSWLISSAEQRAESY